MGKFQWFGILVILGLAGSGKAQQQAVMPSPAIASAVGPLFKNFKEAYSAASQSFKDRKFDEAVVDYGAAESLSSTGKGKSQMANAQGWTYIQAKKWSEAKKSLSRAVVENGDNKLALKNLGFVEFRLYQYGMV